MRNTTFRTTTLGLVGTPSAAVPIAPRGPTWKRLVVRSGAAATFLSTSAQELEINGQITPGGAFRLPAGVSIVLALEPNEHLMAVAAVAAGQIFVSVSDELPEKQVLVAPQITTTRQRTLPALGTRSIRVVQSGPVPRRVTVFSEFAVSLLSDSAAELNLPGQTIPGFAYQVPAGGTDTFILAPGQPLFGVGLGAVLNVVVSDLAVDLPRGPTGIPGPDGAE